MKTREGLRKAAARSEVRYRRRLLGAKANRASRIEEAPGSPGASFYLR